MIRRSTAVFVATLLGAALAAGCGREAKAPAPPERKLNVFIWSAYLPQDVIDDFAKRTGTKVSVDLYDSNEALLAKLKSGVADYDLVVPSDYMVKILVEEKLVRELDRARLAHWSTLDPRFLDKPFDPHNAHTVPYFWGTTGLGFNKTAVGAVDSWAAVFDPKHKGRILMLDDMRECFAVALKRMGRSLNEKDRAVLRQAAAMLREQKRLVRTYNSGDFSNILASGDVDLAHGYNGQLAEAARSAPERLAYVVPKEGGTLWLDSMAIPAASRHVDVAYEFIDFLLQPEIGARLVNGTSYASANLAARQFIRPEILADPAIYPSDEVVARCELIEDLGDTTTLLDELWTEIKAQ